MTWFAGFPRLDPAIPSAGPLSTQVQYASCAFLYRYPDETGRAGTRVVADAAAGPPRLSRDGRTYTFTVRRSFRFNTGARLSAAHFAHAINRGLSPAIDSPGALLLRDVVGADAVAAGRTRRARGVVARGQTLRIRLRTRVPDLPARLAASYFCAVPTSLPLAPFAGTFPSAGPYHLAEFVRDRRIVLRRNPRYRGRRPTRWSQIVYSLGQPIDAVAQQVESGDADVAITAPNVHAALRSRYGVNRRQFWAAPAWWTHCLALNTERPLFANNARLRRAVNFAIDRRALAETFGSLAGRTTDQYLPRIMRGFRDASIYRRDLRRARALARGHTRTGRVVYYQQNSTPTAGSRALIVQSNLRAIGLEAEIVQPSLSADPRRRGEPFDVFDTACARPGDYIDPFALNVSFHGRMIRAERNVNVSYFDSRRFNRELARAARLSGERRFRRYAALDAELARTAAPAAAFADGNHVAFVGRRIGCVELTPLYGLSLVGLCLRDP